MIILKKGIHYLVPHFHYGAAYRAVFYDTQFHTVGVVLQITLAVFKPENNQSVMRIPAAHTTDQIDFLFRMLSGMGMRTSGLGSRDWGVPS